MGEWTVTLMIGAVALAAAVAAYFRSPDKWIFPVVLALVGVVLCGANAVSAKLPDGTVIQITGKLAASADANFEQLQSQRTAIDALVQNLDAVQKVLDVLTVAVQQQAAATKQTVVAAAGPAPDGAPPVATPPPAAVAATAAAAQAAEQAAPLLRQFEVTRADLRTQLDLGRRNSDKALAANRDLRAAVKDLRAQ